MIHRSINKFLLLLLLCCGFQHIHAVDWFTATVGVIIACLGFASDEPGTQKENTTYQRPTQRPSSSHTTTQQPSSQKPNKEKLQKYIDEQLKKLAGIDEQSSIIKLGLWSKKQKLVDDTMQQNFPTHQQAERYAFERLPGGISDFIVQKAVEAADQKITGSNKVQAKEIIAQYFHNQALEKLSNKQPVTELLKNIDKEVDAYMRKKHFEFIQHQRPPVVVHNTTPSAPSLEALQNTPSSGLYPNIHEIQAQAGEFVEEILPQGKKDINLFKSETRDKEIYPEKECPSCFEPFFTELKKRSTLRCGHQLCTKCLYEWIKTKREQNVPPTCPKCRHPIESEDFNLPYLRSKL